LKTFTKNILHIIRKYLWVLLVIGAISLVLSLILYFITMSWGLSKNSSDWGNFGSYIGGTVGIIFSGINVLILIILTFKTKEQQNHEWITGIRINKYQALIDNLKNNPNPQQYFINKSLDDDFFLFDDNYDTLIKIEKKLQTNYTSKVKDDFLKFLKAIIKSQEKVVQEVILEYKS
jgi:hypothetical protein